MVEVTRKLELPGLGASEANRLRERLSTSDDPILQRSVGPGRTVTERRINWYKFLEFVQSVAFRAEAEAPSTEPTYSEETTARYNVTSAPR
jgi:hypothetical protein